MNEVMQQTEWTEPRKRASAGRAIWRVLTFPFRIFERIVHGIAYLVVIALIVVGIGTGLFNWWASAPMQVAPQTAGGLLPPQGMSLGALITHAEAQPPMQPYGFRTYALQKIVPMAIASVINAQSLQPSDEQAQSLERTLGFALPWNEIKGSLGDKIRATRYLADNMVWLTYVNTAKSLGCFDLGGTPAPAAKGV